MPLINANDIVTLRDLDIHINDRTFLLAFDVVQRSPLLVTPAERNGQPLYAIPGGERGTVQEIRQMLESS